jgi:hypothetical protein
MAEMPKVMVELTRGEIARLDVRSGDIVVLTYPGRLVRRDREYILAALKAQLPEGVQAMLLCDGMTASVLRPESQADTPLVVPKGGEHG